MSTAAEPAVLYERRGPIGIATLNRPQTLNAMSAGMMDELVRIVQAADGGGDVKVLILTAAGKGFCSGMDVSEMQAEKKLGGSPMTWPRPRPDRQPVLIMRQSNIPIVGAINGVAAGGGMGLALGPDIRIMSDKARLIPIFLKRGLQPDMGTSYTLTRAVGAQKALELVWTAEPIGPEEALRLGLVARVVPHERLMDEAIGLAERLAKGPAVAMALAKRAVYRAESGTLDLDLEFGTFSQERLMRTEDFVEGYKSFIEKRDPQFKGQ
jgi:2-(1,2-epoxy-1,2-dihydrophenyl)acetyl-CoA isomerase